MYIYILLPEKKGRDKRELIKYLHLFMVSIHFFRNIFNSLYLEVNNCISHSTLLTAAEILVGNYSGQQLIMNTYLLELWAS